MTGDKHPGVDLSGLDALSNFGNISFGSLIEGEGVVPPTVIKVSDGKPLMLLLDDIEEDPEQPRIEFSSEKMEEMRESIRGNIKAGRSPIKTPISVKKHPTQPGKWLLNDGARRYRCAKLESLVEIPAFEDAEHDDYDQMVVNIQREGHTPLEIALFIQRREAKGDKKGQIAKRLGKSASYVSKHAALIDMPPSVRQAYDAGRCREVEALYLLVKNFEEFPGQIDALCLAESTEVISKYTVAELLDSLKRPTPPRGDQTGPHDVNDKHVDEQDCGKEEGNGGKQAAQDKIRKPIVQIEHNERLASLLLDRRAANGLAWIKYDDGHEIEIDVGTAKLVAIVDGFGHV